MFLGMDACYQILFNMFPRPSGNYIGHGAGLDPEPDAQFSIPDAFRMQPPHFNDLAICEQCASVPLSLTGFRMHMKIMPISGCASSLADSISYILQVCPKEKVVRVHAFSVVALMEDVHIIRNFGLTYFPRYAMRHLHLAIHPKTSITLSSPCIRRPHPTLPEMWNMAWYRPVLVNLLPKVVVLARIQLEKFRGFCDGIFSSLHRLILCGLLAISRATNTGDGDFFYASEGLHPQG